MSAGSSFVSCAMAVLLGPAFFTMFVLFAEYSRGGLKTSLLEAITTVLALMALSVPLGIPFSIAITFLATSVLAGLEKITKITVAKVVLVCTLVSAIMFGVTPLSGVGAYREFDSGALTLASCLAGAGAIVGMFFWLMNSRPVQNEDD